MRCSSAVATSRAEEVLASPLTLPHNARIAFALPPLVPRYGNTPQYSHYSAMFGPLVDLMQAFGRRFAADTGFADGRQLNAMLSRPCGSASSDGLYRPH